MSIVYEDDLVTLYQADYRDHLAELADMQVDAVITDPPYGETSLPWDVWPEGWVDDAATISKALWCFGSFRMFHDQAADFSAWKYSQDFIWEKQNGSGMLNDRFRRVHELAVLWYRGPWSEIRHETPRTFDAAKRLVRRSGKPSHLHGATGAVVHQSEEGGPRLMRSVAYVRNDHGSAICETQKPVGIVSPLVQYSAPQGGLVVDFFAGSASTLIAARQHGVRAIGFEKRASMARDAAKRLSQQEFDLTGVAS